MGPHPHGSSLRDSPAARAALGLRTPVAARIRYLASCHEADNRESAIFDLFHRDVKHRHFATGTEVLLSGMQDALAVPTEVGIQALAEASAYRREKSLVYGVFFLVGRIDGRDGRERRLAAPLLHYPASLHRQTVAGEEATLLRITGADPTLNFPVLAELLGDDDGATGALESAFRRLPQPPMGAEGLSEIIQIFRELLPAVRVEDLYGYPLLLSEREVRKTGTDAALACIPAAAMALVENPRSTRGVLFELGRLGSEESFSAPLRAALEGERIDALSAASALASIPAVLSHAQRQVLQSASRHPLTLVVGPPGTGKSYTVTALALEHLARGESVLVAARTEQALNVIESKLRSMLGESTPVLRGGASDHTRELKSFLTLLLSGQFDVPGGKTVWELARDLRRTERALVRAERRIAKRHRLDTAWGELDSRRSSSGVWSRLREKVLGWRLRRESPAWTLLEDVERLDSERVALAAALFHRRRQDRISALLKNHRKELVRFSSAFRARSSGRQEALFAEMKLPILLEAFPLWMCTFRDLNRLAPWEREMFDLVVIDEATQSDMASALPALYHARRAAVTGDPQQLRHVSFLSRERQRLFGEGAGLSEEETGALDYREKSLLDLVDEALSSQDQALFLDEHFRSMPQIIAFSNREFYRDRLRVMTARPETLRRRAVELRPVEGERGEDGCNRAEAEALLAELGAIAGLPRERGFLSPGPRFGAFTSCDLVQNV